MRRHKFWLNTHTHARHTLFKGTIRHLILCNACGKWRNVQCASSIKRPSPADKAIPYIPLLGGTCTWIMVIRPTAHEQSRNISASKPQCRCRRRIDTWLSRQFPEYRSLFCEIKYSSINFIVSFERSRASEILCLAFPLFPNYYLLSTFVSANKNGFACIFQRSVVVWAMERWAKCKWRIK